MKNPNMNTPFLDPEKPGLTLYRLFNLVIILIMTFQAPASAIAAVWTDPLDYSPGSTVLIEGNNHDDDNEHNWLPGELVDVFVEGPNDYTAECQGQADSSPLAYWSCSVTLWDNALAVGTYNYTATGQDSGNVETGTFTDAAPPSLEQLWQCDPPSVFDPNTYTCVSSGATGWVTGNNDGPLSEGDTIPYRTRMQNLVADNQYSITIEWDTTKSSKHAIDYLKTWNATITAADPCISLTGLPAGLCSTVSTHPIPADTFMQSDPAWIANAGVQDPGVFTMYGGTITDVSAYATPPTYNGDTATSITIYFTASSTDIVFAWGGHIGERDDWGLDNSAVFITGSPYHMRILTWYDVTKNQTLNAGNTDRSLSADAVIYPASITIIKDADREGSTSFLFTAGPSPLNDFSLVDGGSIVFGDIKTFTLYTISESSVVGWTLDSIVCTVTNANGGNQTVSLPTVEINLKEAENVTCTFYNNLNPVYSLNVEKSSTSAAITAAGQVVDYSFVVTNTGNMPLSGITVTDAYCDTAPAYVTGDANSDSKLDLSESWTYTCSHTVTQAEIDSNGGGDGDLDNTVTADADMAEPDTDDYFISITQTAALTLVKTATPATYDSVGVVIGYSFLLTNSGNVTLSGPFTITDDKAMDEACPATPASLAPDEFITCTASYTISQADLDAGSVTNTAQGHGYFGTTPVDSNYDDETVTAVKSPALTIVKTATPTTYDAVEDVISYNYLVTNSGNVTLHNIYVVDDKATVSCPAEAASLVPGASVTCTATYMIVQADLDAGSVTNTAYATDGITQSEPNSETVTAVPMPTLTIVKTATPSTYDSVGDVVSYSYLLTNSGNVTLADPFTVDDDKATVTCPTEPTSLAPGDSIICTASYTITQSDLDAGSVTNTAQGHGFFGSTPVDSNQDSETVTAVQAPALTLVKTATPATYDSVGDVISYSYLVTNIGNVTLAGPVTVTDDKATVTCPSGGLAPQASMTCTASYTISQADLDDGTLKNTAQAHANGTDSNYDDETVTAVRSPTLTLVKTAIPLTYAAVGDVINYSFELTNSGNVTLVAPFTVTDDKSADEACPATPTSLAPGASITCTASYAISQADLDASSVTNTAMGHGFFGETPVDSNEDSETVTAVQTPALTLDKTVTESTYDSVGDLLTYSYELTNTGNITLSAPYSVDDDKTTVTCPETPVALSPNASVTCFATYAVTQGDIDAGFVTNLATGHAFFSQTEIDSNQDSTTVNATQSPALTLEKTGTFDAGGDGSADVGELITYEFTVTNEGNVTLTGITVTDPKVTNITFMSGDTDQDGKLDVDETWIYSGSYAVTQADIDAGSVYNLATADSNESEPDDGDNTEPLPQDPKLSLVKTGTFDAGLDGYADPGELISYEFLVTNTGNVTLHNVTVTDPKVSSISCPADTLAVGTGMTCTGTYTVTQADIDAGSVYNLATVDSNESGSDEDDETVKLPQNPAIDIVKTGTFDAGEDGYADPGELISYEFLVTNDGNVTLNGITVTDSLFGLALISCPADTLDVGAFMTCTTSYTVTQADIDAGFVYNLATADSNESGPDDDDHNQLLPQDPKLSIVKTGTWVDGDGDGYADVGEAINYQFSVSNIGNVTLTGITVTDPLPGLSAITCSRTILLVNEITLCTATYAVTQADIDAGSVYNMATADSNESEPDDDEVTIMLTQNPLLSIVKTGTFDAGADGYADPGELISYEFLVTNDGNVTLTGITVTDPKVNPISCPATTLAVGVSMTCTGTYAVTQADIDAGFVYNLATADSNESGPDDGDNNEPLPQNPVISLVKSGTFDAGADGYANVGELISYSFWVTNSGNVILTGITVTDPKVSPISCPATTLAVGAGMTCTGTYALTQDDIDAGSVYNLATADSKESEPEDDDHNQPLPQNPLISIVKTGTFDAGVNGFADPGELISYEFLVTNEGNVTLNGITVTDPLVGLSVIFCPADTLAVGASMICTATYAVTQADIDAGSVYNMATADSTQSGPDDDDHNQPLQQHSLLSIVKTGTWIDGDGDSYADVSETINYSFFVSNIGNVTLTGVTVTDPLPGLSAIDCPGTTLMVKESMICTTTYAVTQADIDAGMVDNTATADSTQSGPATDDESVTLPQHPLLSIVKIGAWVDGDGDGYADVGEAINYTFAVKNEGNVTLHNVTVVDTVGDVTVSGGPTTLDVGETDTTTFIGVYYLTQTDIDAGNFFNTATADSNESGPASDNEDVLLPQNPAIEILKSGTWVDSDDDGYADVGEAINYIFTVKNTGNVTLFNVVVTDQFVTVVGGPLASLAVGAEDSTTFTASYVLTQTDIDAGHVFNIATACGYDEQEDKACDNGNDDVPTPQNPAIAIDKTTNGMDGGFFLGGSAITWEYEVTNTGNVTLSNIAVTDNQGVSVTCPKTKLAVGESMTCTATGSATLGLYENTGTVMADDPQGDDTTHSDDSSYFGADPEIDIEKYVSIDGGITWGDADTATGPYLNEGTAPLFKFVVTNTGNVPLSAVHVTDSDFTLPDDCIASTLAVGASVDCIVTGTWAQGQHTNTATAFGSFTDDNGITETDSESDTANYFGANPEIDVEKYVSIDGGTNWLDADTATGPYLVSGTNPLFRFVVTNTGNVTLSSISLEDTDFDLTGCTVPTTLIAGASFECVVSATAVTGQHTNTATASGSFTDGAGNIESASGTDDANYFGANPSFTVAKQCISAQPIPQDGPAKFSVAFTNNGNVDLSITADDGIGTFELAVGAMKSFEVTLNDSFVNKTTADNTVNASSTYTDSASHSTTVEHSASASCRVGSRVNVLKLTQGQVDPTLTWTFSLWAGANGFGGTQLATSSTNGDIDGLLVFGNINLDKNQSYTLCENEVNAGWTSFWQVDTNNDGVADTTIIPYNPNADDDPPADLGNRCVNFGAGTGIDLLNDGGTLFFQVNNTYPGGEPRTPGYWKNWNRCTGGGQQYTSDANGGYLNGFWLLEDVLDPVIGGGIQWDDILADNFLFPITSCELGVDILGAIDYKDGTNRNSDSAYTLAKALFAAQLNFGAGARTCDVALDAALAGEQLLDKYDFDAVGPSLPNNDKKVRADYNLAVSIAKTLDQYNNGLLCTGPMVSFEEPQDTDVVSGPTVTLVVNVIDMGPVAQVEFFVDGVSLGVDSNAVDGWSIAWDSTSVMDGSHILKAVAMNGAAQTGSADLTITTENGNAPPVLPTIKVTSLTGSSTTVNKNTWKAAVVVTVNPVTAGAVVTGLWSNGASFTCTTDGLGKCTVTLNVSIKVSSITLTVSNITLGGYVYDPSGDTTETINKP